MNSSATRLLIVEDSVTDVLFLRRALREHGLAAEITVVGDGDRALEYLEHCPVEQRPHVIVIDINLPKRDGIEVLQKCRFNPALTDIKTLIFTSSDEPSDHLRADMIGVDAYVRKPVLVDDFAIVVSAIRKLLDANHTEPVA